MNLQIWLFASFRHTYMYNNIYNNNTIFIDVWCIFDPKKNKSELFGGALCSPIFVESKLKINKK